MLYPTDLPAAPGRETPPLQHRGLPRLEIHVEESIDSRWSIPGGFAPRLTNAYTIAPSVTITSPGQVVAGR
jgi:hypothetical protein